jgi:hypothetical protein
MSKISNILVGLDLDREELKELIALADQLLKSKRSYTIRPVSKRCGKLGCPCRDGAPHGPYLYVTYRDKGRNKQRSLGLQLSEEETDYLLDEPIPDWKNEKYRVSPSRYEKLKDWERHEQGLRSYRLDRDEFEEVYGISYEDDNLNRSKTLWVAYSQYHRDLEVWEDTQRALYSKWGQSIGLGTSKGHVILLGLEEPRPPKSPSTCTRAWRSD